MDIMSRDFLFVWLLFGVELLTQVYAPRPYINDEACPRKPELAMNRKCLKKCRTDVDCKGRNRYCMCDDVCGKACVKPSLKCEPPKPIFNGKFDVVPSSNVFGARVRYSCDKFYTLIGDSERVCQGDGYWSSRPPSCKEEGNMADTAMVPILGKCHDPPRVDHAYQDGPRGQMVFPLGTQLNYQCEDGYNIDGFFRSMCVGDGRWVGPRMTCSPRRCGHPGDIQYGTREGNTFVYPNRVRYTCTDGYEMLGRSFRVCMANGKWSGTLPSCKPIKCARLSSPEHGEMHGTDNTYGAEIRYKCDKGYNLRGSRVRMCEHSGQWSGEDSKCQEVDCGQPGPFYNGFLDGTTTNYGSEYQFRCFGWTTFEGPSLYSTCQENGQWSHKVPKCWGRCTYPSIVNGTLHKPGGSDEGFTAHGTLLNVTCGKGHALNTTDAAKCYNGTWTFVPECVPAPCEKRPQEIREGYVRFYTMRHGDKAKYKCNTGYQLLGDEYVTCQYGEWIGRVPKCAELYCPYPGTIDNGLVLLVGQIGKYEYRSYVRRTEHNQQIEFHCSKEYRRVGPSAATCVDGKWSPSMKPKCIPKKHPKLLYLFRGKRSLPQTDSDELEGELTTELQTMDTEEKGFCEVPSVSRAQNISLPVGYYVPHHTELTITCRKRFTVVSPPPGDSAVCEDGVWSMDISCRKRCSRPGALDHGKILLVGEIGKYEYRSYVKYIAVDQVIEYVCESGYLRVGPPSAMCSDDKWSPKGKPKCVNATDPKFFSQSRHKRSVVQNLQRTEHLQPHSEHTEVLQSDRQHTEHSLTEGQHPGSQQPDGQHPPDGVTEDGVVYSNEKGFCEVPSVPHAHNQSLPAGYYVPHNTDLTATCTHGYLTAPPGESVRCDDGVWTAEVACVEVNDAEHLVDEESLQSLAKHHKSSKTTKHRNRNRKLSDYHRQAMDENEAELNEIRHAQSGHKR